MSLPSAPANEETVDACCARCGSLWHPTDQHPQANAVMGLVGMDAAEEFPPGYDPAEADRLIGRDPDEA
jgi:hypothetical protein